MAKRDYSTSYLSRAVEETRKKEKDDYSKSYISTAANKIRQEEEYKALNEQAMSSASTKVEDKQTKVNNIIASNPNMSVDLDALKNEYNDLLTKKTNLTTPTNAKVTGGETLLSYSQLNNSIKSLDDAISKKNREIKTIENSQKKTNMEADAIGSDDYDYYTNIGSSIENPTTSQARGIATLKDPLKLFTEDGGLHLFGKDVNNIVTYSRDNYDEIRMEGSGAVGDEKYHFMTDDEVGVYNYYLAKENEGLVGKGTAQSYLDSINEILNQRVAENRYETQDFENDIVKELAYGMVEAGPEQWRSGKIGFIKSLKGEDTGLDTTTTQYLSQMIRQDLADDGPEILGNSLGQAAYDFNTTTANMIPSILLSKWAGSIGSASGMSASATKIFSRGLGAVDMGASAAGNSYQEMINEGYNVDQAKTYAYINGALEAGLEYAIGGVADLGGRLTGHQIQKLTKMVNNTALKIAIEYGGEALSEAVEEGLQEALDPFVKAYATGEYAEISDDYVQDILYSALLGAISSVPFNTASNVGLNSNIKSDYGSKQQEYVAEGLEADKGTNSRIQAERNQKKLDKGKNLNARELRYQMEANEDAVIGKDKSTIAEATEERLTELGETGNVKDLARIIAESVAGEEISRKDQKTLDSGKYTKRVLNELNPENIARGNYTTDWAENINTKAINKTAYNLKNIISDSVANKKYKVSEEEIKDKISSSGKTQVVSEDGQTATDTEIKSIKSLSNGKMTFELTDGTVVDSSKILYANKENAYLYESVLSADYSVSSANAIVQGYNSADDVTVSQYLLGINEAYNYGKSGVSLNSVHNDGFINNLTDTQKQFAYDLGRYDAGLQTSESNARVNNAKTKNPLYKKGKVIISQSVKATTPRQKASLSAIGRVVANVTHNNVVIYESVVNEKGKRVFATNVGGYLAGKAAPHGFYDPNTGTIYIDINSGNKGEGTMLWTFAHELTHYIREWSPTKFKVLADFLFEEYGNKGVNTKDLIQAQIDKAAANGRTISEDTAYEEVVADSMSNMFTDTNALDKIERLKKRSMELVEKIKSIISDILAKIKGEYNKLDPQTPEAKYVKSMTESLERLSDLFAEALVDAGENFDQIGIEYYSDMEAVAPTALSERTWSASEYVNQVDAVAEQIANELGVSKQTALKYIKDINSVAKSIADDRVRLDYEPNIDPNATTLKPNSEYKWSVDMSTLCAKRLLFTGTFDEIQKRLPNKVFNSEDIIALRKMMMDRGYQVACGPCYVESTRREIGEVTNQFIERYKLSQKNGKPITRVNSSGEVKILTEKDTQRTFVADKNYTPTMADLNTTDIDKVKVEHPDVYAAYLSFMNARGQQKPKLLETRAEYKGEILDVFKRKANGELSKATISRNNSGGLRLQSFSDFEVAHLIDMMQVVMDMSRVGLKSQAYTKVPEFAEAFGNTGIKINLSLIAKGSGVDKNGKLIFDDIEGIDSKRAFELRKKFSKNVGTILVGKNDAHIIAAMADSRIDYIIPFHKSQWKESLYEALGLTGYEDYTDYQNEKSINPDRKIKNFDPSEYWDFSKSGDENAQIYLKKCKEDGRIPKFPKFQNYPGYWKLLIDFKMYDNDGFGAEQQPVRPIFNNATNQKILKNYEGGHRSFKVAEDVVNDFVSQYQDGELLSDRAIEQGYTSADTSLDQVPALHKSSVVKWGETNLDIGGALESVYRQTHNGEQLYSDRDSDGSILSDGQMDFFSDSKARDSKGNLLALYHGTSEKFDVFEANRFIREKNGISLIKGYFSEDKDYAQTYGDTDKYYLNIKKPLVLDGEAKTLEGWRQLFKSNGINGVVFDSSLTGENGTKDTLKGARYEDGEYFTFYEIFDMSNYWTGDGNLTEKIAEAGYDGIQTNDKYEKAWMPFNENAIKLASNKTPTQSESVRYSERDENPTDSRSLLANALLTSAQNDTERKYIADYQKSIEKINAAQNRLAEVNSKIKELSFAEGPKDKDQIRLLKEEATKLANNISTYDKKLLRLESTKPIKNVLAREKTVAKEKAEERSKARLETYKQKAIAKQEKLAETYAERQERAIARYKDRSAGREQKLTDKYEARLEREKQRRLDSINREEERIENLKESHKKYVERVKEREQKLKDEARFKKEVKAQNRNAQELKTRIRKIADDLRKMLSNPTENRYVPYPLVNSVIDVCNAIDSTGRTYYKPGTHEIDVEKTRASYNETSKVAQKFATSRQALLELKLQYDELKNAPDYDFSSEFNEVFSYHIKELADAVGDTPVREMTDDQLSDVHDILFDIRNMIMSAKMQIGLVERITNYEAGQEIIDNMQTVKDLGLTTNQILTFFREWTENPMRATREMSGFDPNSRLVKLFEALDEGRRKADEFRMINSKTFDALRKTKADEKAFNDAVQKANLPVTDINDNTVMISHMQALQALLTWEREQANPNRNHLGTPVKFTDVELESKGKYDEYAGHEVLVDEDFINTVMENLTEWDKKYLDAARTFFRVVSRNAINEVSLVTKHRLIALEELYVPYYVNQDYIAKESENVKFDATIEGMGMLKSVKDNAPQQLIIRGLNTILADHIDKVAKVYGLAIPVRNWNKAFNVVQTQKDGGKAVREAVGETWGKGGKELLDQAVADLQSKRKGGNSKLLSTVKSGFVTSTLASNISVWMKQAASYPTAGAFLSAKSLAEAAPYFVRNLSAIHDEIDEHTSQHYIRRIGLSTQELGEINQTNGWQNKLNRKLGNWSPMNWIQAMDVKTTAVLWIACKNEVESKGISKTDENYWNEVTKLYDKVIEETQPMYDPLHRAEITKNDVYKNIIMFQTQPIQNSGILREGAMELKMAIKHYGKNSVQAKEASNKFRMAVGSQVASHFTFTLMTLLSAAVLHKMNRYRDDDDELTPESVFAEFMKQFGENFFGALVPVFGSYMTSIIEKFVDGNRYDVVSDATVDKVNDTINNFVKLKNPSWDAFLNMASDIASYFGIPSGNLLNIINGARLHIEDAINGEFGSFEAGVERTSTQNVNRSYEAYVSGNTEKFNSIEVDQSSVTRVLKPQFLEAYSKNDTETMANIRRYMKATKVYKNDVVEVTQNWIKNSKK